MILTKTWKQGTWIGGNNIGDGEGDENRTLHILPCIIGRGSGDVGIILETRVSCPDREVFWNTRYHTVRLGYLWGYCRASTARNE
jgi:hypothetical protein